ncbi:MAG TPA: hypothetical protein VGF59_34515, partial [Bryobacteraceae bacterium]
MAAPNPQSIALRTDDAAGPHPHDAHGKALALNLDGSIYGTLAEIGAGQEVARWFLSVGGASGTVAKTISAYDKNVSDQIYGAGTRYVSRERLLGMLAREYALVLERLGPIRGKEKRFFVFADTIAARNYQGSNEQHGWLGIRFQTEPGSDPSQVLLHVNLRDSTAQRQQETIGTFGVNLIYAAFRHRSDVHTFLAGLYEGLSLARIELDVIALDGPAFSAEDANQWTLSALCSKMAHAVVFDSHGIAVEPSSILRKRPLLVMRGTFANPDLLDAGLIRSAARQLAAEDPPCEREPAALLEMTIRHVSHSAPPSPAEMLNIMAQLTPRGPVMASDFPETYLLSRYLRRYSTEPVRFVVSIAAAAKILHERFYRDLPGTLLEGLGKLLATNVKLYVAPMPREDFLAALRDMPDTL